MGVRFPSVASTTFVGPFPANNTETVVCVTPPLTLPLDSAVIQILWFLAYVVGTGTTSVNINLRRGTTVAGASIRANAWGIPVTAGGGAFISGSYVDTPGAVTGQQYALTIVQTGATVAGSAPDVSMMAFAL